MITRSDDYVEYCRETAKHARDLHDLALRGRDQKETTRVVHEHLVEAVELSANDELVDVGCGDGTLLRLAQDRGVRKAIGILPTDEEVSLLRRTGLEVHRGFTDKLPLPDEIASVVVCNNVLLVVPREKIPQSFRELARIAKRGGRVYAGEIPFAQPHDPTPAFKGRGEYLSYLYHKQGIESLVGDGSADDLVATDGPTRDYSSGNGCFVFFYAGGSHRACQRCWFEIDTLLAS